MTNKNEEYILVTTKWKITYGGDGSREAALQAVMKCECVMGAVSDGAYSTVLLDSRINNTSA